VTKWREYLRAVALIINILLVVFLIGSKGWWMSMGLGIPLIVAPLLSVIALSVRPSGWRKALTSASCSARSATNGRTKWAS